jgi:hypothetical protein
MDWSTQAGLAAEAAIEPLPIAMSKTATEAETSTHASRPLRTEVPLIPTAIRCPPFKTAARQRPVRREHSEDPERDAVASTVETDVSGRPTACVVRIGQSSGTLTVPQ